MVHINVRGQRKKKKRRTKASIMRSTCRAAAFRRAEVRIELVWASRPPGLDHYRRPHDEAESRAADRSVRRSGARQLTHAWSPCALCRACIAQPSTTPRCAVAHRKGCRRAFTVLLGHWLSRPITAPSLVHQWLGPAGDAVEEETW